MSGAAVSRLGEEGCSADDITLVMTGHWTLDSEEALVNKARSPRQRCRSLRPSLLQTQRDILRRFATCVILNGN